MNRKEEKTKKKINIKNKKGITLIALVITIIVLLILAGVSIAMLTGQNGILTQASNAKREQEYSSVVEGIKLAVNEYITEKETGETTQSFIDWLKAEEREYINDANEIQVSNLLGQSLSTGKGSGQKDVYKLEEVTETAKLASTEKVAAMEVETNKKYEVVYYGEDETRTSIEIIQVATTEALQETDSSLFVVDEKGTISLKDWDAYYMGDKVWTIENVVIPSEVDGKEVKAIGYKMFCSNNGNFNNIRSIVIPNGVITIGAEAFESCRRLININIPEGVTYIGSRAFTDCIIESIKIPNSVTEIGYNAFYGWTENQKIYVPFNKGEKPEGWDNNWLGYSCNATIVYANGEEESANQVN